MDKIPVVENQTQALTFTYFLGGESAFEAITLTEREGQPMDVLTPYYHDREMLNTQSCVDAIGFSAENEILCESPEHLHDLHRVDSPTHVHAHIKKPSDEILELLSVLFQRHLDQELATRHFKHFKMALSYLRASPSTTGLFFEGDDQSFVHNGTCADLEQHLTIDTQGFQTIGEVFDLRSNKVLPATSTKEFSAA